MNAETHSNLLQAALALRSNGFSILPVDHRTKKPQLDLLPRNHQYKPVWEPFTRQIPDEGTVRSWFETDLRSFAVIGGRVSGGLVVLDFDVPGFYEAWLERVGQLAAGLPVQRTGGGGYQVFFRCPNRIGNTKLAWARSESEPSGRTIAIETRGEGGYAIVAPSLHPSGKRYEMVAGDLCQVRAVSEAIADALIGAARKQDQAPHTRQEQLRIEAETLREHDRCVVARRNGDGRIIGRFNKAHPIGSMLRRFGYIPAGDRFIRPGGKSASVSIRNGRSFHFSSNDPLNDGRSGLGCHDAFDIYCLQVHKGDVRAAVKEVAGQMPDHSPAPPDRDSRRHNPPKGALRADETPSFNSADEVMSASARDSHGYISWQNQPPPFQPFPTDTLPNPLATFIHQAGEAIGCDASFIALPLLVGLATAIGMTRRIRLKADWSEFPVIWAVIVAGSGQRKSPAFSAALQPLQAMQHELMEEHAREISQYRRDLLAYKQALARQKDNGVLLPEEPAKPRLTRLIVNDTTVEALAMILEQNPRGVAVVRDELSGWLASFNQYKSGKGSDASQWLELHRGGVLIVDRKAAERPTIYVPRAAVNIGGTIQPGILARQFGREQFDCGLVARTLFAMPPARVRQWSDRQVDVAVRDGLAGVYAKLLTLDFDSNHNPIDLVLGSEALERFTHFVNELGEEQAKLSDERLEAAWSKLEGYAARLALIVHLVRWANEELSLGDANIIDRQSIECGITLARWFGHEAVRVYGDMAIDPAERPKHRLVELIRARGGAITVRELVRNYRRYGNSDIAERALEELVVRGLASWKQVPSGPHGGRPMKQLVLLTSGADTDETPGDNAARGVPSAQLTENQGCVGAATEGPEQIASGLEGLTEEAAL